MNINRKFNRMFKSTPSQSDLPEDYVVYSGLIKLSERSKQVFQTPPYCAAYNNSATTRNKTHTSMNNNKNI